MWEEVDDVGRIKTVEKRNKGEERHTKKRKSKSVKINKYEK